MIILPTDKFQRWVNDLQKAQPVHPDQTKQTILSAMHPKRRKWPWIVSAIAVAMIIFGVSAATLPPVQEVLAKVPVIGKLFQSAELTIVANAGKLQGVNRTQSDNGVTIKLKSAYVQGRTIGVRGVVSGIDDHATTSGRNIVYHLASKSNHLHMNKASWNLQKDHAYTFELVGNVDHLASGRKIQVPLVFTKMFGKKINLRFNLELKAGKPVKVAFKGQTSVSGYRIKVLSAENFDGGIGSLRLRVTKPVNERDYLFGISNIHINGSQKDYGLGALGKHKSTKQSGIYEFQTVALPKKISSLTFNAEVADWSKPEIYALSELPNQLKVPNRAAMYQFQPASLHDNQLEFNFTLSGTTSSDRVLQNDDLPYLMYLQLADTKREHAIVDEYDTKGIGKNRIAPILYWVESSHHFMARVDLSETPFKDKTLDELELVVPSAFEKTRKLPTITIHNQK
ncbi:hypothetical protein FD01_GL000745 [Lacticaseibacillus manihotivorans DSM 13343 = JCM 12514]|jgi:hypothetical protein|uniref:DUF4179 domain-containing protein n=3 Tax=Lacticaseibacillus manihotivorans TaxID=88233 RepID=A0A0R1QSR8_9LACO|nr:hypothetical protein FD01_GL000745 [Lacticaseibacillus manihotivorans DSM 13343 = JCM 12514]QFQ91534.1 DUF4179 domain-containing protein [Lacticaseibacillus manihotivorans]